MKYIVNGKQAKQIDRICIQEAGIPSVVLMERAALRLSEHIRQNYSKKENILIVCGMGNNGADGVCAGRILSEWGYRVSVFLLGNRDKATDEMKQQLAIAEYVKLSFVTNPVLKEYTVLLDGMFGIGLSRDIEGKYREWIEKINAWEGKVIAIDIPSGVDADTGQIFGTAVKADETITFGYTKIGMLLYPGRLFAGKVKTEYIGFLQNAVKQSGVAACIYEKKDCKKMFPKRKPHSNKGTYKKVLVIAGSKEISGAAYFAGAAAYGMGCGLVKIVTQENNRTMLQERIPEALLSIYRGSEEGLSEEERNRVQKELEWASVVVAGPGIGTDRVAKQLLEEVLKEKAKPVVLDADALNLLAQMPQYFDKKNRLSLSENYVLTPHCKEMSRLVKQPVDAVKKSIYDVSKMTDKAVLVLKDAPTLVSDGKRVSINASGNSALAKGGSGDVLSGMIGGLLALGMESFEAAALGVYLHGLTADEYVKSNSSSSMTARDILRLLPKVLP